jgi:glycosyltransferase involved in cell wall biosynthesis
MDRPIRVLHLITRMNVAGAQENTMLSCAMIDRERFPSTLMCGPESGGEPSLLGECRERGVTVAIEPDLVRAPHPVRDLKAVAHLERFMREGRFGVVHTHTSKAGILGRWAARRARVPVVIHTAHGWAFTRRDAPLVRNFWVTLERHFARDCDAIVALGRDDQDLALSLGVGVPDQYRLIRSGIDLEPFEDRSLSMSQARARLGLRPDAFVVGSVGRLSRQKAPHDMLAAFVELQRRHGNTELVLVGEGPLRAEVERAVEASGVKDRVHLLGMRRDLAGVMRAMDVSALASLWEGLPRVVPQSMAAGLPVVATRVGSVEDAVSDGETGWLVAPGDIAALASRLLDLAQHPERASAMGARARERVEEFSVRRMVDQLAALYAECVSRRERAGAGTPR